MSDLPFVGPGYRAYRVARPDDVEIAAPLGSPIHAHDALAADGWHHARCWADGDHRHERPPSWQCCGVTSCEEASALGPFLLWAGDLMSQTYRAAGLLRGVSSFLDAMAVAEVDVYGDPVINAPEVGFDQSAAVRLVSVTVSAEQAHAARRIVDYYGVPARVAQGRGLEFLREACGEFDESGRWCVVCGTRTTGGLCRAHNHQMLVQSVH